MLNPIWYHDEHSTLKRKDKNEIFKQLDFDITHRCNKNCPRCNLRIQTSNFDYLTFDQYSHILSQIDRDHQIKRIKLSGGEPLIHPYFHSLVKTMLSDFNSGRLRSSDSHDGVSIRILTNGKLLNTVQPALFNQLDWRISHYPNWNDDIIQKYNKYENVYIHPYSREFRNPVVNLNISDEKAKQIRENCMFSIRIIGTDLYQCCLAYQAEQNHNIGKVSTYFDKNWKQNWENLETWRACRYCLTALDHL